MLDFSHKINKWNKINWSKKLLHYSRQTLAFGDKHEIWAVRISLFYEELNSTHLETNGVIHCGYNLPMDDYIFSILLWCMADCFLLIQIAGMLKTMLKQKKLWFRPDLEKIILYLWAITTIFKQMLARDKLRHWTRVTRFHSAHNCCFIPNDKQKFSIFFLWADSLHVFFSNYW